MDPKQQNQQKNQGGRQDQGQKNSGKNPQDQQDPAIRSNEEMKDRAFYAPEGQGGQGVREGRGKQQEKKERPETIRQTEQRGGTADEDINLEEEESRRRREAA